MLSSSEQHTRQFLASFGFYFDTDAFQRILTDNTAACARARVRRFGGIIISRFADSPSCAMKLIGACVQQGRSEVGARCKSLWQRVAID